MHLQPQQGRGRNAVDQRGADQDGEDGAGFVHQVLDRGRRREGGQRQVHAGQDDGGRSRHSYGSHRFHVKIGAAYDG